MYTRYNYQLLKLMEAKIIITSKDSFINCVEYLNLFAIKLFIDNALVDQNTLNNALLACVGKNPNLQIVELLLDHGSANGWVNQNTLDDALQLCIDKYLNIEYIKIFQTHGATLPTDIVKLINLPDEIFYESIVNLLYEVDLKLLCKCLQSKIFSEKKWQTISTNINFDTFSETDLYMLLYISAESDKYNIFYSLTNYVKHNDKFLFLLLLEIGSGDVFNASLAKFLSSLLTLTHNQLILCQIANTMKLPHILNSIKTNYIKKYKKD